MCAAQTTNHDCAQRSDPKFCLDQLWLLWVTKRTSARILSLPILTDKLPIDEYDSTTRDNHYIAPVLVPGLTIEARLTHKNTAENMDLGLL